jgi:hypothetical protein
MNLYEINTEYLALMSAVENGEIPEEAIADTLEGIEGEIEIKVDNIACMLKNIAAEVAAFKAEEERLAERRKVKERLYERVKGYLSSEMLRVNLTKVETTRNKIGFRASKSVTITDTDGFLAWAMTGHEELLSFSKPTPNKTEIKKALEGGADIFGAQLVTSQNIQIK